MSNDDAASSANEWTKFGVLIIVMVGIVLVVGLSRPFLFGHIIPIILGEGTLSIRPPLELSPPVLSAPLDIGTPGKGVEAPVEGETISPSVESEPADLVTGGEVKAPEAQLTEETPGSEATEASAAGTQPAVVQGATEAQTLLPEMERPTSYVVKTGDTLIGIAEAYGVTVDAIVDANGLANPHRIAIGERLTIPEP